MPRGDKSKYTDKQDRKAEHIEQSYESRGVPEKEAERRAWATVNKDDGGGKKAGGSGRENRRAIPPRTRVGRLAAPHQLPDRLRADRKRPERLPLHVSETPPTGPIRARDKHD
jgi:hypothetical protein